MKNERSFPAGLGRTEDRRTKATSYPGKLLKDGDLEESVKEAMVFCTFIP